MNAVVVSHTDHLNTRSSIKQNEAWVGLNQVSSTLQPARANLTVWDSAGRHGQCCSAARRDSGLAANLAC